eukprot:TRINITY_DN3400_c0_g1_i1.p1 TRINITY_DN3400_c0_g1~~TRINITY_DN3400_c0_g1_i1.p1  ORF type:complete len:464 (-),score=100.40 TRINITY_DN3400_c0_g1_i1:414-1805(-)
MHSESHTPKAAAAAQVDGGAEGENRAENRADAEAVGGPVPLRRRMSDAGLMIIETEWHTNRSVPTFLMELAGKELHKQELVELFQRLASNFPRFRSRVDLSSASYVELDSGASFCIDDHLHMVEVGGEDEEFLQVIDSFQNAPLDKSKPLWDAWLITVRTEEKPKQYIFMRAHHCLGDGMAIGHALSTMCDHRPSLPSPPPSGPLGLRKLARLMLFWLWVGIGSIAVVLRWMYMSAFYPKVPSLFDGVKVGTERRTGHRRLFSLEECKAVRGKLKFQPTLNDVFLGLVSHAIDVYSEYQGHEVRRQSAVGLAMPVNVRRSPVSEDLGNSFGSWSIFLPLGYSSMVERIKDVHARTRTVKSIPEQYITNMLTFVCARLPLFASRFIVNSMCEMVKLTITNVRGADERMVFLGREAVSLFGYLPPPNGVGLGIGMCSYAGDVRTSGSLTLTLSFFLLSLFLSLCV